MIKLYIVRHGETSFNVEGRIQGQLDAPLTPLGVRQAQAVASRLSMKFDAIYSSDLGRARITAEIIAQRHNMTVQQTPLLRESYFGVVQGMTHAEIESKFPEELHEWRRNPSMRPPEAESREQIVARCREFLNELERSHSDGETVLAVGHGGSLRGLVVAACGLPVSSYRIFPAANACLCILDIGERPAIRLWNDTSHLDCLVGTENDADNAAG